MKIKLEVDRIELAEEALSNESFGGTPVADCGSFVADGDVYSCVVYLDDIEYDDLVPVTFTVWFEGDKIVKTAYDVC